MEIGALLIMNGLEEKKGLSSPMQLISLHQRNHLLLFHPQITPLKNAVCRKAL